MIKNTQQRIFVFLRLPLLIHWITIIILTSLPSDSLPSSGLDDKIEHIIAYFVLSFFIYFNFYYQDRHLILRKYSFLFTILFASLYGAVDELHQLFIPGRSCDFLDWVADFIGVIIGSLSARLLLYYLRETLENFFNKKLEPLTKKIVK
ncbi:MAG: VanZ family protein [Ignavibacterium sp.]|nr:VanZ family protein [Ignavibacterium sp.]MCX7611044.1 VanZ family protein [Ignavibacterium sp.]MDW8376334.1 VanZ family protein [Ignavibacteriales bacterium]